MNIPSIGGARGIFEYFVPGTFVLMNLGLVALLLPFVDDETREFILATADNPILILVVAVGFGYLIGVLLRLFRTEYPDKWSAAWLRKTYRLAHRDNDDNKPGLWASEDFPYIGWLEEVCKQYLSPEAESFYKKIWADRKQDGQNRQFFNFCKVLISSEDERSANEINAAEALSRYIAGMFYAVVLSFVLVLFTVVLRLVYYGQITVGLVLILLTYLAAIVIILNFFRFVRIKEVEIVFAASFKNRSIFTEEIVVEDQMETLEDVPKSIS